MPTILSKFKESVNRIIKASDSDRLRRRRVIGNFIYKWMPTLQLSTQRICCTVLFTVLLEFFYLFQVTVCYWPFHILS